MTAPVVEEVDCGEYRQVYDDGDSGDAHAEEQACLLGAFERGDPAVLIQVAVTPEGEPIKEQYRVIGPRLVQVVTDTTRAHEGQGVFTSECPQLTVSDWGRLGGLDCVTTE